MWLRLALGLCVTLSSEIAWTSELVAASDDFSHQYDERVDVEAHYWGPADDSANQESEAEFSQRGAGEEQEIVDAGGVIGQASP